MESPTSARQTELFKAALQRLEAAFVGQGGPGVLPADLALLQRAVSEDKIRVEGDRTVVIVGDAKGAEIHTGDTFQLSGEAVRSLFDYQPLDWDTPSELPEAGLLPPGYTLPFSQNEEFVGRREDLLALAEALYFTPRGGSKPPRHVIVSGLGGAGKTMLAVEFCFRYGRFFKGVHWVQAGRDISQEILACGAAMRLADWPASASERVEATLMAWSRGGHLVVFDDLQDPQALESWQPRLANASLLVTSRLAGWPAGCSALVHPLGMLPRRESAALLRRATPRLAGEREADVETIARQLGDLPLALALAGAFLHANERVTLAAYLEELERLGGLMLIDETEVDPRALPTRHQDTVDATLRVQWEALESAPACLALKAAALLGGQAGVERARLSRFTGLPDQASGVQAAPLETALKSLRALSLLEGLTDYEVRLHPLVEEFAARPETGAQEIPALVAALRALAMDPHAPETERRLAVALLLRLEWLDRGDQEIPAPEILACLDLAGSGTLSPADCRYLLEKAVLPRLKLGKAGFTPHERANLFQHAGALHAQSGEAPKAEKAYRQARQIVRKLLAAQPWPPEDLRLAARVYLGSANVLCAQAEELGPFDPHRKALLEKSVNLYREAARQASAFGLDALLEVKILRELSYTASLLEAWRPAELAAHAALEGLGRYIETYAAMLETAGNIHFNHGQALGRSPAALEEYLAAYRITGDMIAFLKIVANDSDLQVIAHINAGDFLLEIDQFPTQPFPDPLVEACEHWKTARRIARNLGLGELEAEASQRLDENCLD